MEEIQGHIQNGGLRVSMDEFPEYIRSGGLCTYRNVACVEKVKNTLRDFRSTVIRKLQDNALHPVGDTIIWFSSLKCGYYPETTTDYNIINVAYSILKRELEERFGDDFEVRRVDGDEQFVIRMNFEPLGEEEIYELWEQSIRSNTK